MRKHLTPNQVRGFWAAWAGWALDGMDSFIYALVLVPALRDLLPRSGLAATADNIGYYGGVLFAIFLMGWGCAFLWGPIADRFGRVRTLVLTILCYSLFTFLGSVAAGVWQLALFRFLAGAGIGGEWTLGGVFVAEEWPEELRKQGAAWMHTGYYFGVFLAAIVNYTIGSRHGWRAVFAVGGTPALLVAFIRYGVSEPQRWQNRLQKLGRQWTARDAFRMLFSSEYRRRTIVNSALLLISMVGLWAGSVYVPSSVNYLASHEGYRPAEAARMASYATMLLSAGTILGCLLLPFTADRLGRRVSLGFYFVLMFLFISVGFGYVYYLGHHALRWFMVCLFFLGVGGANFAVYTLWLPEQYRTECRGSAFAFATSFGRFVAAGITFLVGAGVARMHTIGTPVALTSAAFLLGILLLRWAEETTGKELPS
ncbi:Major facilitator superfamily MFS_1 [Candidatus Sulfopaludibacter sp. SbA6]|nr:Major facilitator superfamily MFS_1 [Candidatus Sulfopaludibacter sp. SbA6]